MKKSAVVLLAMMMLLAGCGGGRRAEMRERLQALNAVNRADTVLTASHRDEAQELANWFDRHGSANEQLLAHYLLGRCYADMNEAPMALHCYQEAISRADTTAADCDFAQLSRVYGQSATIFYQQGLYRNQLYCSEHSYKFGLLGHDTLASLIVFANKASAYDKLLQRDSSISIYMKAIRLLKKNHYYKEGSSFSGVLAKKLIDNGVLVGVDSLLEDYEQNTGYFDSIGHIAKGREIYYYWKGLYYLKNNQLDSAEYYFRKELRTGKDFNNQNCGAYGLSLLFQQLQRYDSAAHYSHYSYAMNDSAYAQLATQEVEQAKAMYDYSRQQEIAQQEKGRADKQTVRLLVMGIVALVLLIISGIIAILFYLQQKKRKAEIAKYHDLLLQLKQAQADISTLRVHRTEFKQLVDKKESDIHHLELDGLALKEAEAEVKRLREKEKQLNELVKEKEEAIADQQAQLAKFEQRQAELAHKEKTELEKLSNNPIYQKLLCKSSKGELLSQNDWDEIDTLVKDVLPGFYEFLVAKKNYLNEKEYRVCALTRLHMPGKTAAVFLGIAPSYITKYRKDLHEKIFHGNGDSKAFISLLFAIG